MWTWFSNEMRGRIPIWKSYQIFHLRVVLLFTSFVPLWEYSLKKFAIRYLRMKRAKEVSFITLLLQQILFVFVEQVTQMEKTPNISKKWGLLWKNFIVTSRQIIHKWQRDIVLSLRGSRLVRQTSTSVLQRRVGRGLKLSYQVSLLAITMERRSLPLRISSRILMPFCTKKREDQAFN